MRVAVEFKESNNKKLDKFINKNGNLDIYINATFQFEDSGFQTSNIVKLTTSDEILVIQTKNSVYKFKPTNTTIQNDLELNYVNSNNLEQDLEEFFDISDKTQIGF
ncbi:MAG TPA: hypothetical protein ENK66_10395 [Arcobacter sp.]|jgi:hypothetical protein|nr:hypothetical protein [Arcobacter sp.]